MMMFYELTKSSVANAIKYQATLFIRAMENTYLTQASKLFNFKTSLSTVEDNPNSSNT